MSTALASVKSTELNSMQIDLIKKTVAKGATDDELKLFLHNCNRLGLDPFAKQIHFIKYGTSAGTIIVGIDGFRLVAHRTGKLSGIKRGALKDEDGALIGAWAEVYRTDWTHPAREEVPLREYFKPGKDGKPSNWDKMPETMIKKVAEAAALRMAFPADLSGVYSDEEMDQAAVEQKSEPALQNGEQTASGVHGATLYVGEPSEQTLEQLGDYIMLAAPWADQKLGSLEISVVENELEFWRDRKKAGAKISGKKLSDLMHMSAYIDKGYALECPES